MMRERKDQAMNRMKRFLALCAMVLLAGAAGISHATSLAAVNLAQIVENTEAAFVGTVRSVEVVETPKGWAEKVTAEVKEPILGGVQAGQTVVWLQYRVSEIARMPGMPKYAEGEEHLLFLAGKGTGTDFQAAYGLGQGSFRVHRERDTGRAFVRNEFMNAQLFMGIDTEELAKAVVEADPERSRLAPEVKTATVTRQQAQFRTQRMGATDLETIKQAAKALGSVKNPSARFAAKDSDTTESRSPVKTFVLQGHSN